MSDLTNLSNSEQQPEDILNETIEDISNCEDIDSIKRIIEDLKEKIKKGLIDPLNLKTSSIFDKLVLMVYNSQYATLTDSIDSLFEILGIKIEEVKQFILRIEAKEAITRFLNQYKENPNQDLLFTRYLVDFWTYNIEVPGISTDKIEEIMIKYLTKTKKEQRVFEVPEEIKAREEDFIPIMSEKIMEDKALQYLENVKNKFPIQLDQLILETALVDINVDDALKLYEYKKNIADKSKRKEENCEEQELSGIECFSYILLLIQLHKITFDSETNMLYLI